MKKTLTALAVLGMIAASPAFANDRMSNMDRMNMDRMSNADRMSNMHSQSTTYTTQQTVYHNVQVPLTREQVIERQQMGTKIEQNISRVDTNNDRQLNRAEYYYSSHMFNIDDSNQANAFYNIDTNHNGQLSSQELLKAELAAKEGVVPPVAVESEMNNGHRTVRHHSMYR